MSNNKKVKNASLTQYNNISFKSKLERDCYIKLSEEGFNPVYEKNRYTLVSPIKLKYGTLYSKRKKLLCKNTSIRELTYTPDFEFEYKGVMVFYDAKGIPNDSYPIKKKLFLHYLETLKIPYIFFEPHNNSQVEQSIAILYELCGKD